MSFNKSARSYWSWREVSVFRPPRPLISLLTIIAITLLLLQTFPQLWNILKSGRSETKQPFRWENIIPSRELEYIECFDGHQCARLQVPLDWNSTEENGDESTVAIAIVKRVARVPVTDPHYGGAIIANPGGPGVSGVEFVLRRGASFQVIADSGTKPSKGLLPTNAAEDKYFDIIGLDPRGINNTTPGFSCFENEISMRTWETLDRTVGFSMNKSEDAFQRIWAHKYAVGSSCSDLNKNLGRFVGTASVVRDIVEIAERHGEWRQKEAERLSRECRRSTDVDGIYKRTVWRKGREKLLYWGYSYGTFLGQSLASMYPDRVERMVLDGVIDPMSYITWNYSEDLRDIDAVVTCFAETCYQAGPEKCPIYTSGGVSEVENAINQILQDIKARPIAQSTDRGPLVISYNDVVLSMFTSTYRPIGGFQEMAQMLHDVSNGNISTFVAAVAQQSCANYPSRPKEDAGSAFLGVLCIDGDDMTGIPQADFRSKVRDLRISSRRFGDLLASLSLVCRGYTTRAKWRFAGPFGGHTAHPILFASSSFDPVCPLHYAYRASKLFPGSAVVQSTGYGHCTFAMPSLCVAKNLRRYFQTGVLPENGTLCEVDREPFSGMLQNELSQDDTELSIVIEQISESWQSGKIGWRSVL